MMTNAQHNREQALRLFEAGWTPAAIAKEFPLVWELSAQGEIGQIYHKDATASLHRSDPLAKQFGLLETNVSIVSVRDPRDSRDRLPLAPGWPR